MVGGYALINVEYIFPEAKVSWDGIPRTNDWDKWRKRGREREMKGQAYIHTDRQIYERVD